MVNISPTFTQTIPADMILRKTTYFCHCERQRLRSIPSGKQSQSLKLLSSCVSPVSLTSSRRCTCVTARDSLTSLIGAFCCLFQRSCANIAPASEAKPLFGLTVAPQYVANPTAPLDTASPAALFYLV